MGAPALERSGAGAVERRFLEQRAVVAVVVLVPRTALQYVRIGIRQVGRSRAVEFATGAEDRIESEHIAVYGRRRGPDRGRREAVARVQVDDVGAGRAA